MRNDILIRPEEHKDYKEIIRLVLRSFQEGTDYSDGSDIIALIEEIRDSIYYMPELAFVAVSDSQIVGHFIFSKFPILSSPDAKHGNDPSSDIVMLAPVSVHADHFMEGIGSTMLRLGIDEVKKRGFKGITVEGNPSFYHRVGFRTSLEYQIHATSGYPLQDPNCMMCQELYDGALNDINGYVIYDMYYNT